MEVSIDLEQLRRDINELRERLDKLIAVQEYATGMTSSNSVKRGVRPIGRSRRAQTPGQAELAEKLLKELGRPAKTGEMVEIALKRGDLKVTSNRRVLENGFYNAMARQKDRFYLKERGTWDLVERK